MPCRLSMKFVLASLVFAYASATIAAETPSPEATAVRQTVAAFVKAFNADDAVAMHAAWTEAGDFVNEAGKRFRMKELIVADRQAEDKPARKLTLEVEQVRLVTPSVATVDGFSILQQGENGQSHHSKFTATLVRSQDKWLFDSIRESAAVSNSHHQHLAELGWMLGEWVGEHENARLHSKLGWSEDGNYLVRTYEFTLPGRGTHTGTQRIGWDARNNVFRCWTFSSDGGYAIGSLKPVAGGFESDMFGVTAEGQATTNIARYLRGEDNTLTYESVESTLDGQELPPIKLQLKRKTASAAPHVPPRSTAR